MLVEEEELANASLDGRERRVRNRLAAFMTTVRETETALRQTYVLANQDGVDLLATSISAHATSPVTLARDTLVVGGVTENKDAQLEAVTVQRAAVVSPGFTTTATP